MRRFLTTTLVLALCCLCCSPCWGQEKRRAATRTMTELIASMKRIAGGARVQPQDRQNLTLTLTPIRAGIRISF